MDELSGIQNVHQRVQYSGEGQQEEIDAIILSLPDKQENGDGEYIEGELQLYISMLLSEFDLKYATFYKTSERSGTMSRPFSSFPRPFVLRRVLRPFSSLAIFAAARSVSSSQVGSP